MWIEDVVKTTYRGATDTHGSHYVVRFRGHAHRVGYDYAASNPAREAALTVARRYVGATARVLYSGQSTRGTSVRWAVATD